MSKYVLASFNQGYVTKPGEPTDYTNNLDKAQKFETEQEAIMARTGNQRIILIDHIVKETTK
jgi:hypothetical protein